MTDTAEAARGLHYVADSSPGIRRVRRGKGSATRADAPVDDRPRRVGLSSRRGPTFDLQGPEGPPQATGRDARGRKQYRYHDRWRSVRDADKYDRLFDFGRHLEGQREGNISIVWFAHGWIWLIPLADGTTSVGAVCCPRYLKSRKKTMK
jgi:hypothetical protein